MRYVLCGFFFFLGIFGRAQQQDKVDFIHAEAVLNPMFEKKQIEGVVTYEFTVLEDTTTIFLDAQHMDFSKVLLDNKETEYHNDGKTIGIQHRFKKGTTHHITLTYSTKPKQTLYFIQQMGGVQQVWTQGQGKYTSHWLPSFDDMNEKVIFDLTLVYNKNYEVIANGKLKHTQIDGDLKRWSFSMDKPMSSYLLAFAIGDYEKKVLQEKSSVPLSVYYYKKDSMLVEPTYRHTTTIFNFLEQEIGVKYPWQNYKQIPVKDFLYAGMENTGTTIFSDAFMIDSIGLNDKNYRNINAHEMAHQWFGNLVTEENGEHHWLHEGFATYYALLAEAHILGKEYGFWKFYESAKQLQKRSQNKKGEALVNPKANSLTFYEKGAWALYALRHEVGDTAFRTGIRRYLKEHEFKNVTISDFIQIMETVSQQDLKAFRTVWLETPSFPFDKAMTYLKTDSKDVALFLALERELTTSLADNEQIITRYWKQSNSDRLKEEIIRRYHKSIPSILRPEIENGSLKLRQTLAASIDRISLQEKEWFISLLDDQSYTTVENALYKLWIHFPNERKQFLEKTKHHIGFSNKNIRLLWLTLAILTPGYDDGLKQGYYNELSAYTGQSYHFEVRQGAFLYLKEAFQFSDQNLVDLINACVHHSWQFKKYARNLLQELLKEESYHKRITILYPKLDKKELDYITKKMEIQ